MNQESPEHGVNTVLFEESPRGEEREQTEKIFDALGNPVRRALIRMLASAPRSVGELAADLPVSRPAVSRHLRTLEEAGLVSFETRGTRNIYHLNRSAFDTAQRWLDQFWDQALDQLVQLAESPEGP